MGFIQYFFWLAGQSLSALLYFWPITTVLCLGFCVAVIFNFPFLPFRFRSRYLLVFIPLGISLLILFWGTIMQHPSNSPHSGVAWPSYVVNALLILQLLLSIVVVCMMKGYRWFSTSVVLLELWIGLACAFLAGMSITGDWL
jgi:hypothetical protein